MTNEFVNEQEIDEAVSIEFALQIDEGDVVEVFERILPSTLTSTVTKSYAMTALAKLDTRFTSTNEYVFSSLVRRSIGVSQVGLL